MPYQPDTIASVIKRLNVQYFLPAIQREYVWQPSQIVQLFDSLMRGYPISSFLFWELKPENQSKWEIYSFLTDFSQRSPHNPIANPMGVPQLTLILDGQQRLTSLLIALRGSYTMKIKHRRWDNPLAWQRYHLYLNLLQDPKENEDGNAVRYGFSFFDGKPTNDGKHHWIPVAKIMEFESEDNFDDFVEEQLEALPDSATRAESNVVRRNLERLHRVVWKDQVVAYYTEHDQDYDRVLDIFVRANDGGTKLSKSDLLLSMVTLKWDGVNAREEIYQFVERLNNDLPRKNNFDKDFIMKTCLVVSDLPVAYKVDNFNQENLKEIRNRWPGIKAAIEKTVELINYFGIDRDNLSSANALIPIVYYIFQNPTAHFLGGSTSFDTNNAALLRKWLLVSLMNNTFSGTSDNALRDARKVLQDCKTGDNFPAAAIDEALARAGRSSFADQYAIDSFLEVSYGKKLAYLALTLLYDNNHWGQKQAHQDHIFPKSLFTEANLTAQGVPAADQEKWIVMADRIGNLQLLLSDENLEKTNKPFDQWIQSRDADFKKQHLIPDDPLLLSFDRFPDFVEAREELIQRRIETLFQ